jgi:diadenosine tetraphosphate (Ap4A) HIT family hydrolase
MSNLASNLICDFCQEFSGQDTWLARELVKIDLKNRILIRENGVVTLVGVGPLSPGYVLVLPVEHSYSISNCSLEQRMEIHSQKDKIATILRNEYGSVVCFEHGAVSSIKRGGACVDHAHLHILPGISGFRERLATEFKEILINNIGEIPSQTDINRPYLYLEDKDGKCYVYQIPDVLPSQYIRRIWADIARMPDKWDWALFPNFPLMKETFLWFSSRIG